MNAIRTLIVEDHDVMRFGLVTLLSREEDIAVVGEAGASRTALALLDRVDVDVVILDLTLPDMDGLQFIKLVHARHPNIPVLVSTMHDEGRYGGRAIAAGARGYVMKSEAPQILLTAIRKVAGGGVYVSEELQDRLLASPSELRAPRRTLSDREMEVLGLLGVGLSSAEIAAKLHRSIKTVDAHRENIKKKLALKNANELMRYAVCWVEEESGSRTAVSHRSASLPGLNEAAAI